VLGLVPGFTSWSTVFVSANSPSTDPVAANTVASEPAGSEPVGSEPVGSTVSGERAALSRDGIVDVARDMVSENGLDRLSLRRLASRLGVTAPALYAHVTDKSDLLRAIAEEGFHDLVGRYQLIDSSDPLRRVRLLTRAYVEQALAEPEIFRLMFLFRPSEIALKSVDNVLASASTAFEIPLRAVADAQAAGHIDQTRDPFQIGLTLWTVAHGAASVLLLGMDFSDTARDELIDSVIDAALRGLAPL